MPKKESNAEDYHKRMMPKSVWDNEMGAVSLIK